MIGWLKGSVRERLEDRIVLDVGDVGYEVMVPARFLASLDAGATSVELHIHTHVREDEITLFGFAQRAERRLFELLMTVSGVGARTAMGILSSLPSDRLVEAIRAGNTSLLRAVPGIGRKTAERLVVELKDRLGAFPAAALPEDRASRPAPATEQEDLVSALVNLGYRRTDAERAVAGVDLSKFASFDRMLRETLKVLAR